MPLSQAFPLNVSNPPTGFVRVAPNYVLAKPQIVIIPFYGAGIADDVVRNVDFSTALGQATGKAKFVHLKLNFIILSTGVLNNYSNIHGATYYDAGITELDFADAGEKEWAVLAVGTTISNKDEFLIQPVDSTGKGHCKFNDGVAGATGNSVSAEIIGYWD